MPYYIHVYVHVHVVGLGFRSRQELLIKRKLLPMVSTVILSMRMGKTGDMSLSR